MVTFHSQDAKLSEKSEDDVAAKGLKNKHKVANNDPRSNISKQTASKEACVPMNGIVARVYEDD